MAYCTTPQKPQSTTCPTFTLTVTAGSSTNTTQNLDWTFTYTTYGYAVDSGSVPYTLKINGDTVKESTYSIGGKGGSTTRTIASGSTTVTKGTSSKSVSFSIHVAWGVTWSGVEVANKDASGSITVGAKTSYTISYNANASDASGAPSDQTKWHGTDLKLSSTKPTRSHYTFNKWNTKSDGSGTSYNPGSTYTSNAAATLYAIWIPDTYTVSYNLNGGTGAISSQTKTYNKNLTLTSTKPSRTNYTFDKWNTKSDGSGTSYNPGATYTANSALTLYAIWKLAVQKPTISNFKVQRCTSSGSLTDDGTYAKITFSWSCDQAAGSNPVTAITINESSTGITVSGNSGNVSVIRGIYSAESSYTITVKVVDTKIGGDGTSASRILPAKKYTIDFLGGGNGVSVGCPASKSDVFESAFAGQFNNGLKVTRPTDFETIDLSYVIPGYGLRAVTETEDLTALKIPGKYRVNSTTLAQTLVSKGQLPANASEGGILMVEQLGTRSTVYFRQTYRQWGTNCREWVRYINNTSVRDWQECIRIVGSNYATGSGSWSYEKYSNGTVHLWGSFSIGKGESLTWHAITRNGVDVGFYCDAKELPSLPFSVSHAFLNVTGRIATCFWTSYDIPAGDTPSQIISLRCNSINNYTSNATEMTVFADVWARW